MDIVENYYAKKQERDKIRHIEEHPDAYEEFAQKHPDLYIGTKPPKYTMLDDRGRVIEAFEQREDGTYKNTTEVEIAKQEVEKAEVDYHRQLRRELLEKQRAAKEAKNA